MKPIINLRLTLSMNSSQRTLKWLNFNYFWKFVFYFPASGYSLSSNKIVRLSWNPANDNIIIKLTCFVCCLAVSEASCLSLVKGMFYVACSCSFRCFCFFIFFTLSIHVIQIVQRIALQSWINISKITGYRI